MLSQNDVGATVAVKNLRASRDFYEKKLGFTPSDGQEHGAVEYRSGKSTLLVYESKYAGTNQATAATWYVENDIEGLVKALSEKGITFEHYEFPGSRLQGDLHVMGKMKAAWFKDPDGNILALVSS